MMLWGTSSLLLVRPVQTPAPEPLGDAAVAPCPALAGRHGGTFLCPDFKACCCVYRASRLGNPGGLEQWQQLPCSPALPGSRCPLGQEKCPCPPRRGTRVRAGGTGSSFCSPAAPKPLRFSACASNLCRALL